MPDEVSPSAKAAAAQRQAARNREADIESIRRGMRPLGEVLREQAIRRGRNPSTQGKPMLKFVVELEPSAGGGLLFTVGVDGITPDAVPVAVAGITAAVQSLTGRASPPPAATPPAPDASPDAVLGHIQVDVLDSGLLRVRSYIDGKCDSAGHFVPGESGQAITVAIKEVRDAVASRVRPQ